MLLPQVQMTRRLSYTPPSRQHTWHNQPHISACCIVHVHATCALSHLCAKVQCDFLSTHLSIFTPRHSGHGQRMYDAAARHRVSKLALCSRAPCGQAHGCVCRTLLSAMVVSATSHVRSAQTAFCWNLGGPLGPWLTPAIYRSLDRQRQSALCDVSCASRSSLIQVAPPAGRAAPAAHVCTRRAISTAMKHAGHAVKHAV